MAATKYWDGSAWQVLPNKTIAYDSDQIGTVKAYAGTVIPTNWMICDGRSLIRGDYPDLFTALGSTSSPWGLSDATHFEIPDLRGRMLVGSGTAGAGGGLSGIGKPVGGSALTARAMAAWAGAEGVTLTGPQSGVNSNAAMSNPGNHTHGMGFAAVRNDAIQTNVAFDNGTNPNSYATGGNGAHTHTLTARTADAVHENMPPWCSVAFVIKASGPQINAGGVLQGAAAPVPSYVSGSLPASPVNGQEVYYVADATNGVLWHLRYNAASASAYKWEFVGGSALVSVVSSSQSGGTGATAADLATVGPAVVLPLAGDYDPMMTVRTSNPTAVAANPTIELHIGATGTIVDANAWMITYFAATASERAILSQNNRLTAQPAARELRMRYAGNGNTVNFGQRVLSVLPVRVG